MRVIWGQFYSLQFNGKPTLLKQPSGANFTEIDGKPELLKHVGQPSGPN